MKITAPSPEAADLLLYADEEENLSVGKLGLMGTWEVAHYLGVEKSRISRWLTELAEGKMPIAPPVARLKSGSFWRIKDVEAKLVAMYEADKSPYGKTEAGLRRWANERREARAARERRAVAA